jgi:hypothetical protein
LPNQTWPNLPWHKPTWHKPTLARTKLGQADPGTNHPWHKPTLAQTNHGKTQPGQNKVANTEPKKIDNKIKHEIKKANLLKSDQTCLKQAD